MGFFLVFGVFFWQKSLDNCGRVKIDGSRIPGADRVVQITDIGKQWIQVENPRGRAFRDKHEIIKRSHMTVLVSIQEEQVSLDILNYLCIFFSSATCLRGFRYRCRQVSQMLAIWPRTCAQVCICRGIPFKGVLLRFQCNMEVFYSDISVCVCFLLLHVLIKKKSVIGKCISHLFSFA